MSVAWDTIEDAIFTWVKNASGLAATQIQWVNQNASRPTPTYISLHLSDITPVGWRDPIDQEQNLSQTGTEIEFRNIGIRRVTLSIQCFGTTAIGTSKPTAILGKVQSALSKASVRDGLNAVSAVPFNIDSAKDISALFGPFIEPRASLDVEFYVSDVDSDYATYIQTVRVEDDITSPIQTFDVVS